MRLAERDARVSHEIRLGLVRILEPAGPAGTKPFGPSALRRDPPTLAMPALLRHPRSLSDDAERPPVEEAESAA